MISSVSDFPRTGTPTEADARVARESVQQLTRILESPTAEVGFRLHRDDNQGEPIRLPLTALRLLKDILAEMAQGHGVTILPLHAEISTQQAAGLLNVSCSYLIGLLDEGKIPFRLEGDQRRIRLDDVIE